MDASNGVFAEFTQDSDILTVDVMEAHHADSIPDDWVCPRCWAYGCAEASVDKELFYEDEMDKCGEDVSPPVTIICGACGHEQEPLRVYALDVNRNEHDIWVQI